MKIDISFLEKLSNSEKYEALKELLYNPKELKRKLIELIKQETSLKYLRDFTVKIEHYKYFIITLKSVNAIKKDVYKKLERIKYALEISESDITTDYFNSTLLVIIELDLKKILNEFRVKHKKEYKQLIDELKKLKENGIYEITHNTAEILQDTLNLHEYSIDALYKLFIDLFFSL